MSNMVLNSSGITVSAMTWPLAPPPLEERISNTSFTVSITLEEKHRDIVSLKIKVHVLIAELSMNSLTLCILLQATSSENDDPESNTVTVVNDTFPMTYIFTVLHVLANTDYDVRAVATYEDDSYANIACNTTQYEGQRLSLTTTRTHWSMYLFCVYYILLGVCTCTYVCRLISDLVMCMKR